MLNKLKNLLINFHLEFKKFFALRILGKKYVRKGKCNACGRCCREIYVRHSKAIIKDEELFNKLKKLHFFYSYLKVTGKNETGLVFECTKLDKEKGICTAYSRRAVICRQYPQEEIFMMGGFVSDDCGFEFIPIESFDKVLNKINKQYQSGKKTKDFIIMR